MSKSAQAKKPIFKKWWFWVIIVVVLIGIGVVASKGDEATKVGDNGGSSQGQTEFVVGDVIAFDGKEVTVKSVERNWNSGNQFITPKDGKEFVKVNVLIENKSDNVVSYNVFDWKIQDSDGSIETTSIGASADDDLSSGELAKGGKKSGSIVFEVPAGDTGLKLHYQPSFWSNKEIIIKL